MCESNKLWNTSINFDFQMPVGIHQRSHARLNRKNSEKRKQTVSVNSKNLRKWELKIDLLTEVLYELVKMFFARIQLTGGPDKHSMSQSKVREFTALIVGQTESRFSVYF